MIRVGIGGWTYEPWRGVFYPPGLAQSKELTHASRQVTAIEINGTFYGSQKPASFRKWHNETPDDFVFSVKGPRFAVNRRVLAEAGESIERFFASGVSELKAKLGPILWQFAATKKFDAEDFAAFVALLPAEVDGVKLRHALEPRHASFATPEFVALARKANAAIVFADSVKYPLIADLSADFVYARLQDAQAEIETGYSAKALDQWAKHAKTWSEGGAPDAFALVAPPAKARKQRDVFVFFINGAKERAPAAAQALIKRLGKGA
jgi:uncharacterized protein YecE (DUF72 family)